MKRKILIALFIAKLAVCFSAVPVMAIPVAFFNLLDSEITIGESFDVELWIDGDGIGEELLAFGFDVSIDHGSNFTYDGYTMGNGFDDDSFVSPNPDIKGSAFPGIAADDVLLATLSFTAFAVGTDTLNALGIFDGAFSGLFYELAGHDIVASLDISVGTITPVPEPATLLLLGAGLASMGFLGRKKFKQ